MEVNVEKIKVELEKYNRLIDDYEDLYLQLYFELNYSSSYWNDGNSFNFYEKIKKDKNKITLAITELKEIKKVYEYIIDSYERFGNKISFNLRRKYNVLEKIDNYLIELDKIIKLYEELDYENLVEEKIILDNQKDTLLKLKNRMTEMRENVKDLFDKLEEIEKNIHYRISKISIEKLKIQDINDFLR